MPTHAIRPRESRQGARRAEGRCYNNFKGRLSKAATEAVKSNQQCAWVARLTKDQGLSASSEAGYTELDHLTAAFHRERMETAAKREAEKEGGD